MKFTVFFWEYLVPKHLQALGIDGGVETLSAALQAEKVGSEAPRSLPLVSPRVYPNAHHKWVARRAPRPTTRWQMHLSVASSAGACRSWFSKASKCAEHQARPEANSPLWEAA